MLGYVYKTTNLINKKIYIGQHRSQFFDDSYFGSGKLITSAIKKYGKESFSVEVLCECNSQDELDNAEMLYIKQYNSTDINVGYNITFGGQARFFTGMHHTLESRQKMSESASNRTYREPTTLGRKYINNGHINKCVPVELIDDYLSDGWVLGKLCTYHCAWNKGLTEDNNNSVKNYVQKRRESINSGTVIGCCGLSGDDNIRRIRRREYLDSLDKSEVYDFWFENGKSATQQKYGAYGESWKYLCSICGIIETKEHQFYIRSKARKSINNK